MRSDAEKRHEDMLWFGPGPKPTLIPQTPKPRLHMDKAEAIPFIRHLTEEGFIHTPHEVKEGFTCYACTSMKHWRPAPENY